MTFDDEPLLLRDVHAELLTAGARWYGQTAAPAEAPREHRRRRGTRRARRVTLAAALGAGVVAAVVAFVAGAGSDPHATARTGNQGDASFAIFNTPATPASVAALPIPAGGAATITRANPHLIKIGQYSVWLTSGDGQYCVALVRPASGTQEPGGLSMACGARADAVSNGMAVTARPAPGAGGPAWWLAALIPDGVSSVTVDVRGQPSQTLAVARNVVAAGLDGVPLRARFTDADGHEHVQRLGDR